MQAPENDSVRLWKLQYLHKKLKEDHAKALQEIGVLKSEVAELEYENQDLKDKLNTSDTLLKLEKAQMKRQVGKIKETATYQVLHMLYKRKAKLVKDLRRQRGELMSKIYQLTKTEK